MGDAYAKLADAYFYCVVCGAAVPLEFHHATLRSQGGKEEGNLVPLCPECHRRRHAELLSITLKDGTLSILDRETGQAWIKPLVPQAASGPSLLVDQARAMQDWLGLLLYGERLRQEPDEVLATLYDELRGLKRRLWTVQAAIINVMLERAQYGEAVAKHVAAALGCSERTVQSRGQIYREIIAKPECAQACERLQEESFYREAVCTDDPVRWINYADERKVANPAYTVAQFRAEIGAQGEESSLQQVVLLCGKRNGADLRLADKLKRQLGVPVELVFLETPAQVQESAPVGGPGRALGALEVPSDLGEVVSLHV